jgi:hypothetical protein
MRLLNVITGLLRCRAARHARFGPSGPCGLIHGCSGKHGLPCGEGPPASQAGGASSTRPSRVAPQDRRRPAPQDRRRPYSFWGCRCSLLAAALRGSEWQVACSGTKWKPRCCWRCSIEGHQVPPKQVAQIIKKRARDAPPGIYPLAECDSINKCQCTLRTWMHGRRTPFVSRADPCLNKSQMSTRILPLALN